MNKAKKKVISIVSIAAAGALAVMAGATAALYANKNYLPKGDKVTVSSGAGLSGDYYDYKCSTKEESLVYAQQVTQQTAEEGMVLLKNESSALPVAKGTKITLLDYWGWHNNMAGGEDPATTNGAVSLYKGLSEDSDFKVNPNVTDSTLGNNPAYGGIAGALNPYKDSYSEYDTAIVTIKRNSGEGNDQTVTVTTSGENGRTGLTLTRAEMEIIDYANKNFNKVIILINSVNTMELGWLDPDDSYMSDDMVYTDPYGTGVTMDCSNIVAAVWVGGCGSQGGKAIANILKGAVNPSGHTADLYARDLTNDPSYVNFGGIKYTNSAALNSYSASSYTVEYEEGIYIGYRYHETAAAEAEKGNYAGYDYDTEVVYPFGYGLSYTTFSQEYEGTPTYDAATETYTFKVKVTNTGNVAGKGVAQIYVNVPWEEGQVEKAHVVLGGFAKTGELSAGESETVTIEISRDYFESYDYITAKAYILDAGEYKFYLGLDEYGSHSWSVIDEMSEEEQAKRVWTDTVSSKITYSGTNKRVSDETTATNVLDDEMNFKFKQWSSSATAGDGYIYDFTRSNFKDSFPTRSTGKDLVVSDEYTLKYYAKYDVWSDTDNTVDEDGNEITEMPVTNSDETSYNLIDMRGVSIDDEKWDDYINQFTVESMENMFGNGGWGQPGDEENGVPATYDADSPYGYYAMQLGISSGSGNTWYCSAPMVAATFNTDLAKEIGDAFGEEAHQLTTNSGGYINGVYGFGMNQHRSAFGGRNYEYYSEDPVLCGKMGCAEAEGASEKGLVVYMKHFLLNDQESYRQSNGYSSWVNEQAYREVYARSWEIYIKEAKMEVKHYVSNAATGQYEMVSTTMSAATGVMTSYNRYGGTYAGASVAINGILRNEWNFTGTVLTDAGGQPSTYMTTDLALRRGQNLCLTNNGDTSLYDTESAVAVWWLKNSTKYLLYNIANSNAMYQTAPGDAFYYSTAGWEIAVIAAWIVVGVLAVGAVVVDVLVAKDVIKVKEKAVTKKDENDDEEY